MWLNSSFFFLNEQPSIYDVGESPRGRPCPSAPTRRRAMAEGHRQGTSRRRTESATRRYEQGICMEKVDTFGNHVCIIISFKSLKTPVFFFASFMVHKTKLLIA